MNLAGKTLIAAACALVMAAATGAAPAAADPSGPIAICHSTTEDGTETDTCVGNPDAGSGYSAPRVWVRPEFCLGIGFGVGVGFGNCDDD